MISWGYRRTSPTVWCQLSTSPFVWCHGLDFGRNNVHTENERQEHHTTTQNRSFSRLNEIWPTISVPRFENLVDIDWQVEHKPVCLMPSDGIRQTGLRWACWYFRHFQEGCWCYSIRLRSLSFVLCFGTVSVLPKVTFLVCKAGLCIWAYLAVWGYRAHSLCKKTMALDLWTVRPLNSSLHQE